MADAVRAPLLLAMLMLMLAVAGDASATAAFSRQTGAGCRTCHFQDMHALNRYGRQFKRNAFHETKAMRERRLRQQKPAQYDKRGD